MCGASCLNGGGCVGPNECDCPSGWTGNRCQTQVTSCAPACLGKECGFDGCSGLCGECASYEVCHFSGICQPRTTIVSVTVDTTKPSGAAWDTFVPSASVPPDIYVIVDGERAAELCLNSFECDFALVLDNAQPLIEIFDEDGEGFGDDLIGSGLCRFGDSCRIGSASVTINP